MLQIYDTLLHKKELFEPIEEGKVGLYHCGPTVYSKQHIGNLRGMFCGDVIVRSLRYLGYEVLHVRNYTDVGHLTSDGDTGEDKMEKGVRREGTSPQEIADKYIGMFEEDTRALNLLEPTIKPRATEYVQEMIEMTKILLDKGYAYTTDLAICFDISKAKHYTALSGQSINDLMEGAGKGDIDDPQKRHATDFVLWFFKAGAHKNALQYWPSPFSSPLVQNGEGFPGWHIECSAMSKKCIGNTVDIHVGGIEHVPIHHTNEIAQSESANGVQFVRYWAHNEHLMVNDRKMAKSEGTGFAVSDAVERGYAPLALRYFFLQAHYRSKQNFTWEALHAASLGLARLHERFCALGDALGNIDPVFDERFVEAISDDFNITEAFAVISDVLRSDIPDGDKRATILAFDEVFGLCLATACKAADIPEEVRLLLVKREEFRAHEQFIQADAVRGEIEALGYEVQDGNAGPSVKKR